MRFTNILFKSIISQSKLHCISSNGLKSCQKVDENIYIFQPDSTYNRSLICSLDEDPKCNIRHCSVTENIISVTHYFCEDSVF